MIPQRLDALDLQILISLEIYLILPVPIVNLKNLMHYSKKVKNKL